MSWVQCIMLTTRTINKYSHIEDIDKIANKVGNFYDEFNIEKDFIKNTDDLFIEELNNKIKNIKADIEKYDNYINRAIKNNDKKSEYLYKHYKYGSLYGLSHFNATCIVDDNLNEYSTEEIEKMIKDNKIKEFKGLILFNVHY